MDLNILENVLAHSVSGFKFEPMDALLLERSNELSRTALFQQLALRFPKMRFRNIALVGWMLVHVDWTWRH